MSTVDRPIGCLTDFLGRDRSALTRRVVCGHIRAGLNDDDAELIRDGPNVIYRFATYVVVPIGSRGSGAVAAREVHGSARLRANGIRAVQVVSDLDQSIRLAGRPMTFWEFLPHDRPSTRGGTRRHFVRTPRVAST